MCEVSLFISSESFEASNKPCQGNSVLFKKGQIEGISKLRGKY